ncbi:M16 family metallopeptidase [Patescibacteria group bacterium]
MDFVKKKLPNGLRVICAPMKNTETVTFLVLVGAGSHYETRDINGISHFLEHMFFKGTKKCPESGELSRRLDAIGAEHNAFTSREETGYWVKTHKRHFSMALGFVADILQNSLMRREEIERERQVIFEEMKMAWDNPMRYIWYIFERHLYGDQPAGWDTIGTFETLKRIKRPQIIEYWQKQYTASNTVVIVSGKVSPKEVFSGVSEAFVSFKKGKPKNAPKLRKIKDGPSVNIFEKNTDQTHLIFGARGFPLNCKERIIAEILATILGGYMSSRLFMEIREKRGLAYAVHAGHQAYTQSGYLAVYAGVPHKAAVKVPIYIAKEFKKVREKGVTEEELSRAKENIRGKLAISLESTDEVASFLGVQELLLKKVLTPAKILKIIDSISENDIKRVAGKMFVSKNYYLAFITPNGSHLQKLKSKI